MNYLNYKNDILHFENISLEEIAEFSGTPTYVYSKEAINKNFNNLNLALENKLGINYDKLIAFSVKSNSNIAFINRLKKLNSGADVVSEGELKRALAAGIKGEKIVFSGVGKTYEEMLYALENNVLQFNIESISELNQLSEIAISNNKIAPIAFRINPDIMAGGHAKISTGGSNTKFGIPYDEAIQIYEYAKNLPGIEIVGIDIHIGSQIINLEPFKMAFEKILVLYNELNKLGHKINNIDLGGGIGVPYLDSEKIFSIDDYAELVKNNFGDLNCKLIFEPGRYLAASAGVLLTKVIRTKNIYNNNFLIVDAAMNDFIRPALYEASHQIKIVSIKDNLEEKIQYKVVGPICETGDYIGEINSFRALTSKDYLIIKDVGAYGAVMSSNYNSRSLVPEVMVSNGNLNIIRKRITTEDFISFENIPS